MVTPLQIFITFDEKIAKRQMEKYFFHSWKKKLPTLIKNFFFIVLFLSIIDSIFKSDRSRIDFLRFIGIFVVIFCLIYLSIFLFNKANYNSKIQKHIAELKEFNPITELYLDENSFYIRSEQYDIRSIWKYVSYEVSGKAIYITAQMGSPFTYIVNQEETDKYQNIIDFLKNKSTLKK
ncbi:hypothetical protein PGH12_10125 [Chryseobacterium wangxinyae]|uniref:hypothetical protein n=1 Tax=Chryseobacterium sp. CY350 TaxID=2997336 RepID=UPI00226E4E40|nr:hypothetical protein [Chryseobacterium sp. CY350]MCY0978787.1 hypothetical protein [Chryseobacterium sp. CY350]WBZ93833.1 hypothetical protein PGH12_10125 [Chryseobacterium sp. CY350]